MFLSPKNELKLKYGNIKFEKILERTLKPLIQGEGKGFREERGEGGVLRGNREGRREARQRKERGHEGSWGTPSSSNLATLLLTIALFNLVYWYSYLQSMQLVIRFKIL
jgi:hypothetical protein